MVPTEDTPVDEHPSGLPEGTVLPTGEKIVNDYDEQGNVIGWHKEAE